MKQQTKFKQTEIRNVGLFILLILLTLPTSYAYKDIGINVKIEPRGLISEDYNVVGDIFIYNITLRNEFNETVNDTFIIELTFPNNQIITNPDLSYFVSIKPNETTSIIPYIDLDKNNDTYIWPFMTSGDYKIGVCSQNQDIRFIKNYEFLRDGYLYKKSNYYFYNCFPYYFSAMPQWQYKLFTEEKAAAEKVQEANQKLLDLNLQLEDATQIIKNATIVMLIVAIITLYVATTEEKDKRGKLYRFIKWISRISVILLMLYIIYLILIFFGLIAVS